MIVDNCFQIAHFVENRICQTITLCIYSVKIKPNGILWLNGATVQQANC